MSNNPENHGKLIVISAPSGTGKSTVIERLRELLPDLVLSVSATTRLPREGEAEGVAYYFVTKDHFRDMIARGDFLEYAEFVGDFYGTPKEPVLQCIEEGRNILLEIEVQGAGQVMAVMPDAVTIFIVPPDMSELERRLRGRGTDSEEKLNARLERAKAELERKDEYAYIVINDDVYRAAAEIAAIINRED